MLVFSLKLCNLLLQLVKLGLLLLKLLLGDLHFLFCGLKGLSFRSNRLVDFIEFNNGNGPLAETFGRL